MRGQQKNPGGSKRPAQMLRSVLGEGAEPGPEPLEADLAQSLAPAATYLLSKAALSGSELPVTAGLCKVGTSHLSGWH